MIEVTDGEKHPDWVRDLLEDFSRTNDDQDVTFDSKGSESVIAVKDGEPAGILMFDSEPSFRINMLHAYPGHDDVIEPMVRSAIAMANVQGKDCVTVHAVDKDGTLRGIFLNMGFKNASNGPCSLRKGTIHMKLSF